MADRFQTLHPHSGKNGVNIDKAEYEVVRTAILEGLESQRDLTFKELRSFVDRKSLEF